MPRPKVDYKLTERETTEEVEEKLLTLDEAQKKKVVTDFGGLIKSAINKRKDKETQWTRADKLWKAKIAPRSFPFIGSSSVGMPVVKTKGRKVIRNIKGSLFRSRPIVPLEPQEEQDVSRVDRAEKFLDSEAKKLMKIEIPTAHVLKDAFKYGTGIMKMTWCLETERVTETLTVNGSFDNPNRDQDILQFATKYPDDVKEYIGRLMEGEKVTLDVSYEKETYRGPRAERVARRDFIGATGYTEVNKMPYYAERMLMSWSDLETAVKDRGFNQAALDKIEAKYRKKTKKRDPEDWTKKQYEVFEGMMVFKANGKVMEKCVFTIIPDESAFLKGMKFPFSHRRAYYIPHYLIPDGDSFDGEALASDLDDIQTLHNMIFNNAVDSDLFNLPTFKVRRDTAGQNFDVSGWHPGMIFDVDDQDDVQQMNAGTTSANSIGLMQMADRFGSDVSGVSELQTGRESSFDPKAPAAKAEMLYEISQQDMSEYQKNFLMGWNEMWFQACELYAQHGTGGKDFRVLNDSGESVFLSAPDDLRVRPDMEPHGGEPLFSKSAKKRNVMQTMELLQRDQIVFPIVAQRPDLWMKVWEQVADVSNPNVAKVIRMIVGYVQGQMQQAQAQGGPNPFPPQQMEPMQQQPPQEG